MNNRLVELLYNPISQLLILAMWVIITATSSDRFFSAALIVTSLMVISTITSIGLKYQEIKTNKQSNRKGH